MMYSNTVFVSQTARLRSHFSSLLKPMNFQSAPQLHASAVEHHPQIGFGNVHHLANFPAAQRLNFPHGESLRQARRQPHQAASEHFPKFVFLKFRRRICAPIGRSKAIGNSPVALPFAIGLESIVLFSAQALEIISARCEVRPARRC